jgi:hypothetical protein
MPDPNLPTAQQEPQVAGSSFFILTRASATTTSWGTDTQNQHSQGKNGKGQLDMLPVNFAGKKGETSKFFIHGIFSFCLMLSSYPPPGFKTGFKRLKKTA